MHHRTLSTLVLAACLAPGALAHAKRPTGKGPCTKAEQCRSGVCVEVNGDAYCSQTCGDCPAGMYCDANLFSAMSLKVCVKGQAESPVAPKAQPRLPCGSDDACPGALICAEFKGHRDCTLPCARDAQCETPEVMGVKMDFLACQKDRGKPSRKACLPKAACMANPAGCMSMDPGAIGGMMKMAQGFAKGAEAMADDMDAAEPDPAPAPAAAPPPAGPSAMDEARFARLLAQVEDADFADERRTVLTTATKRNHFSCRQLGRILDTIDFGDEKVEAVRIVAPRLVDPENGHEVLAKFDFDDDRQKAAQILNAQ